VRHILTALAGAVILILLAALAVPPFVGWEGHRAFLDGVIARSLGVPARSEGRIAVRLLPSPRLRMDRLRIGEGAGLPGLDIRFLRAEIALAPLLKGELRFTQARIGRAELRLPVTEGDAVRVPQNLGEALRRSDLAVEELRIEQFLLTTQVPATGRTDQVQATALHLQAPTLLGPWRIEGLSGAAPFRIATGEPAADGSLPVKLSGGGDTHPRFEADLRLSLGPGPEADPEIRIPEGEGTARLVVGPPTQMAGAYLPFALSGKFKARGPLVRFESVSAEIDPGGQALRLAGTGQIDLRAWRAGLSLEARRLDLDAFLLSGAGQALIERGLPSGPRDLALPVMLDLDLSVESLALGFDEWKGLSASGTIDRSGGLLLRRLAVTAPGATALTASGEIDTVPAPGFTGRVSLDAPASDGLARALRRLGRDGAWTRLLDGRPLSASAEIAAGAGDLSLRALRLSLGDARVAGNARYVRAGADRRGRFDAQLSAQGIDVAALPSFTGALGSLDGHDLGLTIEARDVRYGPAGLRSGAGTVTARIQTDGAALSVDSLDVSGVAGAQASLSGRIEPDGAGRISGRLTAPAAAPLAALLDRVWIAEARLLPEAFRAGALDLAVTAERSAGGEGALRSTAKGGAGGGTLEATLVTRAGHLESADIRAATPRTGRWFGRDDLAGLDRPSDLRLQVKRPSGPARTEPLELTAAGTLAGAALSTPEPVRLDAEDLGPLSGSVRLAGPDLAPFLPLAGVGNPAAGTLPAELALALSRESGLPAGALSGRVAGVGVEARLRRDEAGALSGTATVERLSLPALAAALVAPLGNQSSSAAPRNGWATARFGPAPAGAPRLAIGLTTPALDLGRGLTVTGASAQLGLADGTLSLRDLSGRLAEGRLTASAALSRSGPAASLSGEVSLDDASLRALAGGGPLSGRIGARLRFGASGESPAALVAGLSGSGEIALKALSVPGADPGGLERTLARIVTEDDPLREGRLQALAAEEFGRAAAGAEAEVTAPATLVGGVLRAGPLSLDLGRGRWTGTLAYDLREGRLDARGLFSGGAAPKGWTGAPPAIQLGLTGPLAAPERVLDTAPLTTGLAALLLQRELDKIEILEIDQAERQRRRSRLEMDRARALAEKAAEEAARQARLRAEKAAADKAAEDARQARQREAEQAARRALEEAPPPESRPLDIRPPAAQP